jgi:hypothetical protein
MKLTTLVIVMLWLFPGLGSPGNSVARRQVVPAPLRNCLLPAHPQSDFMGEPSSPRRQKKGRVNRPSPAAIWKGIKSAAQDEVEGQSGLISWPRFTIRKIGSQRILEIVKGDVGELGFRDDPYELPFRKQILIEALRSTLAGTEINRAQASLAAAEILVRKIVVQIESAPANQRAKGELSEYERRIDEILYRRIYESIEREARRKGFDILYGRGGDEIKKFSVKISTVPDGAKVWIMRGLVYRKQLITKTDKSQWPWVEVVQNPFDLLGKYHYLAVWPDGRRAEGDIEVSSPSPIRLLPG